MGGNGQRLSEIARGRLSESNKCDRRSDADAEGRQSKGVGSRRFTMGGCVMEGREASCGWILLLIMRLVRIVGEALQISGKLMDPITANHGEGSSSTHPPTSSPLQWVIDIRNHLREEHLHNSGESERCTISRVPPSMRKIDEHSYIPELVSIGPFHGNNPKLKAMEEQKLRFLYGILDPMTHKTNTIDSSVENWRVQNVTLDGLVRAMKELETRTRECYTEKFDASSSDEFVQMMLLDACFIVELLRLFHKGNLDDPIFSTRFMHRVIWLDLVMLENQLPLFVLEKMYMLTGPYQDDEASFKALAINFLKPMGRGWRDRAISEYGGIHLLALYHCGFTTNQNHPPNIELNLGWEEREGHLPETYWSSNVTVLRCAGISFKRKAGAFLDIKFVNQVLEIPYIDAGKTMFKISRNAIAYEQCNKSTPPYFTTLAFFFKILVNEPRDIELLRKEGIIRTLQSNEDAINYLHKLASGIKRGLREGYCIPEVVQELKKFTKTRWNIWKATLNLYYFVNQEPINLLLFYLTIIQTISSLYLIVFESTKSKHF
ncbi:hypothetical protein L1049_014402 [Liquidambar formosana]|uniref:Uncharacterized protein n=1 Tax=Liquidambar formosana TaxID=63359 RepID=A0AAP0WUY0_LIQFO